MLLRLDCTIPSLYPLYPHLVEVDLEVYPSLDYFV